MGEIATAAAIFSAGKSIIDQRNARREARSTRAQYAAEQQRVATAQAKLDKQLTAAQRRTAQGIARSRRAASNIGLFGDSLGGNISGTLG